MKEMHRLSARDFQLNRKIVRKIMKIENNEKMRCCERVRNLETARGSDRESWSSVVPPLGAGGPACQAG